MNCILCCICSKDSSQRIWGLLSCNFSISWSNKLSPFLHGICCNKLHSDSYIAGHELLEISKEIFVFVFFIEFSDTLGIEFRHLKLVNGKSTLLDSINNLSHVGILVWLDHCECTLSITFKVFSCMNITIVNYFKHTRQNSDLTSNKEIIKLNGWDLLLLEEDSCILDIKHLD